MDIQYSTYIFAEQEGIVQVAKWGNSLAVRLPSAVVEALEWSRGCDRPAAIVCQTKKGCGVSLMEDQFGFHGKPPTPEQAEQALSELEQTLARQNDALGITR